MTETTTPSDEPPIPGDFVREYHAPWQGWWKWGGSDPFEDECGPFFLKRDDLGLVTGFLPVAKNVNGHGTIHGGALMTFADYTLFMLAATSGEFVQGVTVTMNCEFVSATLPGQLLTGRGECIRAGRSLVFVRGTIYSDATAVLSFSGTMKRTKSASAP